MIRRLTLAALVLAAVVMTACGDPTGPSTPTDPNMGVYAGSDT